MPPYLLSLLAAQAASPGSFDVGQIMQTLTAAGVVGLIGWAFRFNSDMARIKTVLLEPDLGIVPRMKGIAKQGHDNAGWLQGHGLKLEEHDRRLGEHASAIDDLKASRPSLQPADVGKPDRRS